ncbi:MAG: threonylcarbamoyl-AMP synthase [Clostridia bacterium]|nr:threonylcarbamoyl-AMP synthase [Clostridia bacterium]
METQIFKVFSENDEAIDKTADILKSGGIVAIPTETVYGLAGNALDGNVTDKIYAAKGRPSDNPLIVHISDISQWRPLVKEIPENAYALADKYWPGPLTVILPKSEIVPDKVSGGLSTVAVRMPSDKIARAIIEKSGVPLAAPSANTSGKPSPTSAKYVIEDLMGKVDAIVDAGECSVGVESTVISLCETPPRLLRPGGITAEMLTDVLGEIVIDDAVFNKLADGKKAASPGMKYKHYSPDTQVIIVKGSFEDFKKFIEKNKTEKTAALCFEGEEKELSVMCVTYGKKNDPAGQAKNIFDALRRVDEIGAEKVFARFPETDGVGLAVFNRLVRAAAFNIIEV